MNCKFSNEPVFPPRRSPLLDVKRACHARGAHVSSSPKADIRSDTFNVRF